VVETTPRSIPPLAVAAAAVASRKASYTAHVGIVLCAKVPDAVCPSVPSVRCALHGVWRVVGPMAEPRSGSSCRSVDGYI